MRRSNEYAQLVLCISSQHSTLNKRRSSEYTLNWYYFWWSFTPWNELNTMRKFCEMSSTLRKVRKKPLHSRLKEAFIWSQKFCTEDEKKNQQFLFTQNSKNVPFCSDHNFVSNAVSISWHIFCFFVRLSIFTCFSSLIVKHFRLDKHNLRNVKIMKAKKKWKKVNQEPYNDMVTFFYIEYSIGEQ